jgi:DNA-binding NarL/FixJ family response regulator
MDLSFADKDGVPATQLARTIGEQGPMPIVVLAGKAEAAAPSGDSQADFTGAVVKPYSPRDLHAALQSALSGAPPTAADHR